MLLITIICLFCQGFCFFLFVSVSFFVVCLWVDVQYMCRCELLHQTTDKMWIYMRCVGTFQSIYWNHVHAKWACLLATMLWPRRDRPLSFFQCTCLCRVCMCVCDSRCLMPANFRVASMLFFSPANIYVKF